jgi:hypothetical protein
VSVDCPPETYADLSLSQLADRLAIRDLVDSYASCADRRDTKGQMALFTADTDYEVYEHSRKPVPTQRFRGRAALAPVFDNLKNYDTTVHFTGQSTVVLETNQARGVTYCLAHLVKADGPARTMMSASIRYLDKDGGGLADKSAQAMVVWTEIRSLPRPVGDGDGQGPPTATTEEMSNQLM